MAEKRDDDTTIDGLSIVDTTPSDTTHAEDQEEDDLVVKIEDEASTKGDIVFEEPAVEEAEEKINLFDVAEEKKKLEKEHSSTLIITTEEHLDTTTYDDTLDSSTETVKNVRNATVDVDSALEVSKISKPKKEENSYFWVSNISRYIKAADLKKYFSQMGKVITAKVLTNGKSYFGYVSVESAEVASMCIEVLNNTVFDGKKILVTKDRPDLREAKPVMKPDSRKKKTLKRSTEMKVVPEEKHEPKIIKKPGEEEEDSKSNMVVELRKELERCKAEINKYKFKILEYQRRHEGMRKKCDNLEKELKEMQYKSRADRRHLNHEKEAFEKEKKLDLMRHEAQKAQLNKELSEVKKLREHLKTKIDEMKTHPKKNTKRTRSPLPPTRSPEGRSPVLRIGSRVTYRSDERSEKKRKRDEPLLGRTPPPPPKLSGNAGKKVPHREYFEDIEKRPSSMERGYEFRHKSSFVPTQEVPRSPWQAPYPKDPRRMNPPPSGGQTYAPDPRYGGGYQFPQANIAVPPRNYYSDFAKPYGHY